MKAKKLLSLVLAAAMALSLCACQGGTTNQTPNTNNPSSANPSNSAQAPTPGADGAPVLTTTDPIQITWSHNNPEASAAHQAALKFKEEIEARSNGVISVRIYPNGELGTVPENDQALREGTIQIVCGVSGGLVDPSLAYFDLPCLVSSADAFEDLFGRGTELRQETESRYNAMGMHVLSLVAGGFAIISSNKEVRSYEDLAGLNIRTSENPIAMEMFRDWGCNPTPVGFGELYVALQQGLVEAQTNSLDTTVSSLLYEQQKYIINSNHSVVPLGIYMNLDFYNNLPEDARALIDWVCENVVDDYTRQLAKAADEKSLQTVIDAGVEIVDFTDEDRAKMLENATPVYNMVGELVGQDLIERIRELL